MLSREMELSLELYRVRGGFLEGEVCKEKAATRCSMTSFPGLLESILGLRLLSPRKTKVVEQCTVRVSR